jgi:hypothetical protein
MSYLDLPRIHFGGLFFTDPSTINNVTAFYTPFVNLKTPDGQYIDQLVPRGRNWNPTGVAQFWLQDCRVLSVVDAVGRSIDAADGDPLIGAVVESPSPTTPQVDADGGYRSLAKLVDLDPDEQGRSAVWGFWIYLKIPGGGGVSGKWITPNLRDAFPRGNGGFPGYMQVIGGTWRSRLTDLTWADAPSPVLQTLKRLSPNALDLKLTVDLYQRERKLDLSDDGKGNRFGYGRLQATIGPVADDEPVQTVPGRRLRTPRGPQPADANRPRPAGAKTGDEKDSPKLLALTASPAPEWNNTYFQVRAVGEKTLLTIDLGCSPPLTATARGKMEVSAPVLLGPQGAAPFRNGTIDIRDGDYVQVVAALERKNTFWLRNSGVYQFELTGDEVAAIQNTPVTLRLGAAVVLTEADDGVALAIEPPVLRMEPNSTNEEAQLVGYRFGVPLEKLPAGLPLTRAVLQWEDIGTDYIQKSLPTTDFTITAAATPAPAGSFRLTVKTGSAVPLVCIREPLDSQIYTVAFVEPSVDEATDRTTDHTKPLTILFWQNHSVVADATWENGIGKILGAYARIYPGMKNRLDIGDKATVRAFANDVMDLMTRSLNDPAFMPVVRDMSPAVVDMIVEWLTKTLEEMESENSPSSPASPAPPPIA